MPRRRALAVLVAMAGSGALLLPGADPARAAGAAAQIRTVSVVAGEDGYVSSAAPTTVHDTERLVAGGASTDRRVTYLKFAVSGIPAGATGVAARLTLARDRHHLPGHVAADTTASGWSEKTLTYRNAPAVGVRLGSVAPTAATTQVQFAAGDVRGNGTYSYAVTSAVTTDVARFSSAESGSTPPVLTITYTPAPEDLSRVWIGASANARSAGGATDYGVGVFQQMDRAAGPLRVRRSFDPGLPTSFQTSAAKGDAAAGYTSFVSWKPPNGDVVGAAAGAYDAAVAAWARTVPATGVYATAYHEPENDMTGAQFVALHRHLYGVVKAANPAIRWGVIYMAYWWEPGTRHFIGDRDAWWPGAQYVDFTGIDTYHPTPQPLREDPQFRSWYDYMAPKGVPMYITEYGQYAVKAGAAPDPAMQARRAAVIAQDAAWIAAEGRIGMWLYWNGHGGAGDWRLTDAASQAAWRQVATSGRKY